MGRMKSSAELTLPLPQQDDSMSLFFSPVRLRTVNPGAGAVWVPSAAVQTCPKCCPDLLHTLLLGPILLLVSTLCSEWELFAQTLLF